jgi:pimeloyl-ACP methyl ester carboxylesterase
VVLPGCVGFPSGDLAVQSTTLARDRTFGQGSHSGPCPNSAPSFEDPILYFVAPVPYHGPLEPASSFPRSAYVTPAGGLSMAGANLLIPGTGGITLEDADGNDVGWPVLMRLKGIIRGIQGKSDQELVELLGMEHRPGQLAPVKTSLKPDTSLHPGRVLRVAYNQVQDGFNTFLYDWRTDLRHSAARLLELVCERRAGDGPWRLVGHSQGGLLILLASKLLDSEDEFARYVDRVTLVGAPVAGTLNAAEAMFLGDNAGERLAPVMRRTIRMWPAIYQMLPAWPAVWDRDGIPLPEAQQLPFPAGWPGVEGIDEDLLLRAREVQALLRYPLTHLEGVDVRFYWAENRKTMTAIQRTDEDPMDWNPVDHEQGDSLVPFGTTLRWIGTQHGPHVTRFKAPCEPHAYLLNDETVVSHLRRRLG